MCKSVVIGMGQVGTAIFNCIHAAGGDVVGIDIGESVADDCDYGAMHICIPYSPDFVDVVTSYIKRYEATVYIIHSTVVPGTTNAIQDRVGDRLVAYSPVRGRHGQMENDIYSFVTFVGAPNTEASLMAAGVMLMTGCRVDIASSATVLELSKLFQTTYTGVLVAWAQEMARYCEKLGVDYYESQSLCEMPNTPPVVHQPGKIGGHCVIPNTHLLDHVMVGLFTDVVRTSNDLMPEPESPRRLWPVPFRQSR